MADSRLSCVVAAGAIDASKEMASLLRLSGVSPNSRSGDVKDGRVLSFHKSVFVCRKSVAGSCSHAGVADSLKSPAVV